MKLIKIKTKIGRTGFALTAVALVGGCLLAACGSDQGTPISTSSLDSSTAVAAGSAGAPVSSADSSGTTVGVSGGGTTTSGSPELGGSPGLPATGGTSSGGANPSAIAATAGQASSIATGVAGAGGVAMAGAAGQGATDQGAGGLGAGGTAAAGSTGVGGEAMGGTAGSGMGGAQAGFGGATGGSGAGGMSSGQIPPDASDGCNKANPQTGSSGSPLMVSGHQYYVKLPTNYDASKPYPALFMFNPTNNPISWAEQSAGFESNGAKDAWIRIYPHPQNSSAGWGAGDVSFFQPLYDTITDSFCVDRARVFAAGESSGGDFSSILGCEHADKLRGIGPCATKNVGQYPLNASNRDCTGQVTAVVIHGLNDNVVGPANGPLTRDFYIDLNHCNAMSVPVEGYTDAMSNCVEYQGCDEGFPVIWCGHTDPEYSGTNHGWPHFAADYLWELFSSY